MFIYRAVERKYIKILKTLNYKNKHIWQTYDLRHYLRTHVPSLGPLSIL